MGLFLEKYKKTIIADGDLPSRWKTVRKELRHFMTKKMVEIAFKNANLP